VFFTTELLLSPSVNAVSDAVIIFELVDSVIYIVHGNKTKREQRSAGLRMMKQVNAPIEGEVINHSENIDTDKYQHKYYNDRAILLSSPQKSEVNFT
jgi:succinoglycan biosynthesis transport protein ExoP